MTVPLTPVDLGRFITEHQIDAAVVPMDMDTPTVSAAAEALGVVPDQIIKTLVFQVKDQPVLLVASGDSMIDRRPIAEKFGVGKKQVRLADRETVLGVTGYEAGGVPPFGHLTRTDVLLDQRICGWDVVYGGGGDDRTLMRVTPAELARVTGGEWIALA